MTEGSLALPLPVEAEPISPLQTLLDRFRAEARTEREKGTYFEHLIVQYLRVEPCYRDRYSEVWTYADWARGDGSQYAMNAADDGIDLVVKTRGTNEYHAIQCKFYAADHTLQKADIDSFFTASGQQPFVHRIIVASTDRWGPRAEQSLHNQQPPVTKIDLGGVGSQPD